MKTKDILIGILIIVIIILGFNVLRGNQGQSLVESSILERVKDTGVVKVGYAAYPPYVIKDQNTGELSGYYIDIMNDLAGRAGFEIEWVETTWQTFISDLQTEKFDVINDPMFATVPRWKEINFTEPIGYFSGVAGLVKNGEFRFDQIENLNNPNVSIAVPQGWTSQEYANKYLSDANIKVFPGDTAALVFADVLSGNSDIALADGPSVQQYLEQNPNQNVKSLYLDNPPAITPAAWGIKKGDIEWLNFLNGSIESMKADGTLRNIAKKYNLYSYTIETDFVPE